MTASAVPTLREARRRLAVDMLGIIVSATAFGFVFGLSAAQSGHYSLIEAIAMSTLLFAGAAQFAGVSLVASGTPWPAIVLLTGLLNIRHLLYAAALAPWFQGVPRVQRAVAAHLLTDEAFALSLAHFRRLGRVDLGGYWLAAIGSTFIPWNLATIAGFLGGQLIDSPEKYGIDVVFPAAMAGLAVGLVTGRREIVAVGAGVAISLIVALAWDPRVAVVVGGLLGPLAGLALPGARDHVPEPHLIPANSVPLGPSTALAEVTEEELVDGPRPGDALVPPPVPFGDLTGVSRTDEDGPTP
ncbi:MAG TPA: AzlC family ABC transporter permease [Candidatus Limnocylindrales bacterium]